MILPIAFQQELVFEIFQPHHGLACGNVGLAVNFSFEKTEKTDIVVADHFISSFDLHRPTNIAALFIEGFSLCRLNQLNILESFEDFWW